MRKVKGCRNVDRREDMKIVERGDGVCVRRIMDLSMSVMTGAVRVEALRAERMSIERRLMRDVAL